jgi:rod shape-determining protein MreC
VSSELIAKTNKERIAAVSIPLLVLQLVLLSLQIERPSGTMLLKTWALAVQAPVVSFSSGMLNSVHRGWTNYFWLVGARAQNEQLKLTVKRLELANSSYEQIRLENERLRRLLDLNKDLPYKTMGARVIARTPSYLANVLYIDKGINDGIRVNSPVISGEGIIGRTILVAKNQSQVQLLTNSDASIGAMVERSRTPGVLSGSGKLSLDLLYISNTEEVANGDIILSSGLDGIYPKGLVLGKVIDSKKGTKTVFRSIEVQPIMDLFRIEEVSVILNDHNSIMGAANQPQKD